MKTQEQIRDMAERFALSQHLTEWDDSLSYGEVLEIIEADDDDERVMVWDTFADWDGASICDAIDNMTAAAVILLKEAQA